MRWRSSDSDSSWCIAGIVFGLLLAGFGAGRIESAYHREHRDRVLSACIAERGVEQCLPTRTAAITRIVKWEGAWGESMLDVYLDGASEPAFGIWPDWSERYSSEVVVADSQGRVWAWQERVHHEWEVLYDPTVPFRTLLYLGLILVGGWFVLRNGSDLLIEGPSRYTELAEQLVATYGGVSAAGMAILFGFSFGWIFGLVSIALVAMVVGINGADHRRHWRAAWRRARRIPR